MLLNFLARAALVVLMAAAIGCGGPAGEKAPEIPPDATTEDAANEGLTTEKPAM
jgi:hypothetical protein